MHLPQHIALLFLILLLGVSGLLYYSRFLKEKAARDELAALLSEEKVLSLDPRTRSAHCMLRGASPDHACTPGAVFPGVTMEKICVPGYSKTVRSVSTKLRKAVFAEYGISYPQPRGAFEVDHFIPLALGGNNDIANLFPQPAEPIPGFHEKDVVEIYLYEEVCAGRAALQAAQEEVSNDWLAIYDKLSPEQIEQIKAEVRSWSN